MSKQRQRKQQHRRRNYRFRRYRRSARTEYSANVRTTRHDLVRTQASREIILSPDQSFQSGGDSLTGNSDWVCTLMWWASALMKIITVLSQFATPMKKNGKVYVASAVPVGCMKVLPLVPSDFIVGTPYKSDFKGENQRKACFKTNFTAARVLNLKVSVSPAVANQEVRGEVVIAVIEMKEKNSQLLDIGLINKMSFDEIVSNYRGKRRDLTPGTTINYYWRPSAGSTASKIQEISMMVDSTDWYNVGHLATVVVIYRNIAFSATPTDKSFSPVNTQLRVKLSANLELSAPSNSSRKVSAFIYHQNHEEKYNVERFGVVREIETSDCDFVDGSILLTENVVESFKDSGRDSPISSQSTLELVDMDV